MLKKNTKSVGRLKRIGGVLDQLRKHTDAVEFLEADIPDKRKFTEATELAGKVRSSLSKVQDAIAKKGGPSVAREYK